MNSDFYQAADYGYTEVAIALEDFKYTDQGKFFIPILIPTKEKGSPKKEKKSKGSTSYIVNYSSKHGISDCEVCNYVELYVPTYIGHEIKDSSDKIKKKTKFIVTFVGGELNNPRIIGLYI